MSFNNNNYKEYQPATIQRIDQQQPNYYQNWPNQQNQNTFEQHSSNNTSYYYQQTNSNYENLEPPSKRFKGEKQHHNYQPQINPQSERLMNTNNNNYQQQFHQSPGKNRSRGKKKKQNKKSNFPPDLQRYVKSAFNLCKTPQEKDEIEKILREKITGLIGSNALISINWDNEPLPEIPPKKEIMRNSPRSPSIDDDFSIDSEEEEEEEMKRRRRERFKPREEKIKHKYQPSRSRSSFHESRYHTNPRKNVFNHKNRYHNMGSSWNESEESWREDDSLRVIGTCENLEKRYFRLTSAPNPSTIRPLHVLKQSLELVKDKWKREHDWSYVCDQLKSIRQDLTVQHIKNEFTVEVYETHARLCLENKDLGEYNQCQTQLIQLYSSNISGCVTEFSAYRVIYTLYENNQVDMSNVLKSIIRDKYIRESSEVIHALSVRKAVVMKNYHLFFKLYKVAPKMSSYVMDFLVDRIRLHALKVMYKAYRISIDISFLQAVLGFATFYDCVEFLKQRRCVIIKEGKSVDPTKSYSGVLDFEREQIETTANDKI